jgi:hypothetical protein
MKRETIGIHTVVAAKLTHFGALVLERYIDTETERATGQQNPKREGPSPQLRRDVEMPLWELMKVFGPSLVSSARQPLGALAKAVGVAGGFVAPELVAHLARHYAADAPPRVPNAGGFWWVGAEVVKVSKEPNGNLTARINGRRCAVSEKQPWRGPAIVDARVCKAESDEDIPF